MCDATCSSAKSPRRYACDRWGDLGRWGTCTKPARCTRRPWGARRSRDQHKRVHVVGGGGPMALSLRIGLRPRALRVVPGVSVVAFVTPRRASCCVADVGTCATRHEPLRSRPGRYACDWWGDLGRWTGAHNERGAPGGREGRGAAVTNNSAAELPFPRDPGLHLAWPPAVNPETSPPNPRNQEPARGRRQPGVESGRPRQDTGWPAGIRVHLTPSHTDEPAGIRVHLTPRHTDEPAGIRLHLTPSHTDEPAGIRLHPPPGTLTSQRGCTKHRDKPETERASRRNASYTRDRTS